MDWTLALLFLVSTGPLWLLILAAIIAEGLLRPSSRGPLFLAEDRINQGRVFRMLKFRTLDRDGLRRFRAGEGDLAAQERRGSLTRVGHLLKRWYLDELPQALNILRGDMSLVGTRPYPVKDFEAEMARGITRKAVIPAGLTGLTQINKGHPERGTSEELDAEYFENYQRLSAPRLLAYDLGILLRTLKTMAEGKGL